MNVAVSGLAAAGKTTHALLLAKWLGFDFASADAQPPRRMEFAPHCLSRPRNRSTEEIPSVEKAVNTVTEALRTRDETVFDSWAAPWLPSAVSCIRVWIESPLEARAQRMRAAGEPHGPRLGLEECRRLLAARDAASLMQHRALLGAGFAADRNVFDVVVDAPMPATGHGADSARRGIAVVHSALMAGITECLPPGWRGTVQGGTVHT